MRVIVVGSINVDLTVALERLPARGETVGGGTLARSGGGKGANQAVAAARYGATVALVGAVGDDDLGEQALAALAADGVDVARVERRAGVSTGVALIVVDRAGDNQIAVASGANHALDGPAVTATLGALGRPPACVLASFELRDEAVLAAARAARAAAWPLIVDPAPARPIPAALAELGPILTPNQHEAAELTGLDDPDAAARQLRDLTGAPVVVTLGAGGAVIADGPATTRVPAPAVRAVDTTGAGDTFNGVLAAELAAGAALVDAARAAARAAALSVTVRGARAGMPTRADVAAARP
jgi:ribokinase